MTGESINGTRRASKRGQAPGRGKGRGNGKAAVRRGQRAAPAKWVYLFAEGNASMKALLGGKGANLAEMTRLGLPVPPGFIVTTEACNAYLGRGRRAARNVGPGARCAGGAGARDRQALRRRRTSAAGVLPLGREVLDARHDGHGAQPRAERRGRRGHGTIDRRCALRLRFVSTAGADVRHRGAGSGRRAVRGGTGAGIAPSAGLPTMRTSRPGT